MGIISVETAPEVVKALIRRVQTENISPEGFCFELRKQGIHFPEAMIYLSQVYGIRLDRAKEIAIKVEYGSEDIWAEDMIRLLDEAKEANRRKWWRFWKRLS